MTPDTPETRVRRYFDRLTASDTAGILALFAPEAEVHSPFLGIMPATAFFAQLDRASSGNRLAVFDVLLGADERSAAAHFQYDWTLASGDLLVFQGVDYFRFAEDGRFSEMRIFYDTHPARAAVGDKYETA